MQENVKKSVRVMNLIVGVLFVPLLAWHCYALAHGQEWHSQTYLPGVDFALVRPLLAFATGYVLFSSLFSLLHGKLEIEESGRRHWLRIVMSAISLLFVAAMLLCLANIHGFSISMSKEIWQFISGICQAEWLWLVLGVYWFLSLNAIRVDELSPLEDEEDLED